ncbi:MAG: peptidoglycan DD-metalloendopeptidase family protein [Flavobacteriales bacterium]|jgi:murein DD-endopeptidase MepM/ murein hydrolase activator NlpD|nr:peptidoglycan DD-metalloendopeptidase family protein [Flavobacteriales bacterium]|tara:strand:+ start:3284 stop:4501 length:1218 start_codon:yes stop_codon:yes gene_type:complete
MKKWFGILVMGTALLFMLSNINTEKKEVVVEQVEEIVEPSYEYDILVDSFQVTKGVVKSGQTMGEILYLNHIDHPEINKIVQKSKGIFDVRRVNAGKNYTVICATDSTEKAQYFIYEIDATNYVVFDLRSEIDVYKGKKPVTVKLKTASGTIKSSLWMTMEEQKLSPKLTAELSTIYAWTIDFFKIQKGDGFRVYYEDKYIDGNYIGIGRILAAEFTHKGQDFYSFYYKENENFGDYYDEEGKTLRKAFLMAPVDYKRISSRYSKRRKHPVTGRWKGHFGTDYAAERGTPIWSTANGTIIAATYTKNNGNYVKVRHNGTYTTQYLHMSKIKPGIRKGVYVKQGDIIGYVGSTGLATGPHVCYRFWKDGKQVDPFKQKLPPGDPIKKENRDTYMLAKDSLMQILMN